MRQQPDLYFGGAGIIFVQFELLNQILFLFRCQNQFILPPLLWLWFF